MTAELRRHIRQPSFGYAILVEIGHPSGTQHLWSGTGTLTYGGQSWRGAGHVAGIGGIEEASELRISEVEAVLTNVPAGEALDASVSVKGYKQKIWWAGITPERRVVPDPVQISETDLDFTAVRTEQDGTHTVVLRSTGGFFVLEEPSERAWTPEQQALDYPDDTGFDFFAEIEDKELIWTRT